MKFTELFDLENLDGNLFRSRITTSNSAGGLYGGAILGQSLCSAAQTVPDDRMPHSLHAYFLRGGTSQMPVIYDIDSPRDGGSFTTRRVLARQKGRSIFGLTCSFHIQEPGHGHSVPMPADIPQPETLESVPQIVAKHKEDPRVHGLMNDTALTGLDIRPLDPSAFFFSETNSNTLSFWVRCKEELPNNQLLHRSILAYLSDFGLVDTMLLPVEGCSGFDDPQIMGASLDHALWFHNDVDMSNWILIHQESDWAGHGRGHARSRIYSKDGVLLASAVQEGLIRPIQKQED